MAARETSQDQMDRCASRRRRGLDVQFAGQKADGLGQAGHRYDLDPLDHGGLGRAAGGQCCYYAAFSAAKRFQPLLLKV